MLLGVASWLQLHHSCRLRLQLKDTKSEIGINISALRTVLVPLLQLAIILSIALSESLHSELNLVLRSFKCRSKTHFLKDSQSLKHNGMRITELIAESFKQGKWYWEVLVAISWYLSAYEQRVHNSVTFQYNHNKMRWINFQLLAIHKINL